MVEDPNIETRPLSFFLKKRAQEQNLEQKVQRRKERLEKRKEEEEERRKTRLDKSRRRSNQEAHYNLSRIDSFLNHAKKSLVSAQKSFDFLPGEIISNKEIGFLTDMISRMEHLQKQMAKKSRTIQDLEIQDRVTLRKSLDESSKKKN